MLELSGIRHPRPLPAVCAAAVCILFGCVYINTFYNAKTAYNTAQRQHRKLMEKYPDSSFTSLSLPQNVTREYDSAISKSMKVLEVFDEKVKWHDDALFLMGRAFYYKGEMNSALRRLRRLQERFPESPFIPESYLYMGKAHLEMGSLNEAEETFGLILERYPELNANEEVSMLLAQVAIRREGKALALELLEKVRESITDDLKKMRLYLQIAELYMDLDQHAKAVGLLRDSPRKKKLPEVLYRIDMAEVTCLVELDSLDEALVATEAMRKEKLYAGHVPEILLAKGKVLKEMGRIDEALKEFQRVVDGYPEHERTGEAWYEKALIYQKHKGDYEQAQECYRKAAAMLKDEEKKAVAEERSQAMALLKKYRETDSLVFTDSTDTTAAAAADTSLDTLADTTANYGVKYLRLGELFWLSLDEPDSAFKYYLLMAEDSLIESDSLPKALYAAGWLALNAINDTSRADSLFDTLLRHYGANDYAKAAQVTRGDTVTVETRGDSAQKYFLRAEDAMFDDDDTEKAVELYLEAFERFPDQAFGQKALYAAAWLNDHVLQKNKTAFTLYRQLCDSFPDSEYCVEGGRERITTVEDSLRVLKARRRSKKASNDREKEPSGSQKEDAHAGNDGTVSANTTKDTLSPTETVGEPAPETSPPSGEPTPDDASAEENRPPSVGRPPEGSHSTDDDSDSILVGRDNTLSSPDEE